MTTINAGLSGKPVNDGGAEPLTFTFKPVDDGTNGNVGGQTTSVSKEQFSQAIVKVGIGGGCPVDPANSSATGGGEKSGVPLDPNRDVSLTSEPGQHKSAIADLLGSMGDKPVFKDASWVSAEEKDDLAPIPAKVPSIPGQPPGTHCETMDGRTVVCDPATIKRETGTGTLADTHVPKAGSKYVDPDADTSGGHSLPNVDSMLSGSKSMPKGLGLDPDQFNSLTGRNLTSGQSGLEKLGLGGGANGTGSSGLGGSTSGGGKTLDDGSGGGGSSDIKGAAASGGKAAAPTGLDALLQKFGIDDAGSHLKSGSFDLTTFSAGLKPDTGIVLDLNGDGKQDAFEWTIAQVAPEKLQTAIVEEFHNNAGWAEFHQSMLSKYAEMHIA